MPHRNQENREKRRPQPSGEDVLASLREEGLACFQGVPESQRDAPTAMPWLSFIRFTQPTELNRGMLEPSVCLVLQGRKKVLIGRQIVRYGAGCYVASAVDMPVAGQVIEATPAAPYLGLKMTLDAHEIAELIIEAQIPPPAQPSRTSIAAYVGEADPELQGAFLRLARLSHQPRDIPVLGHLTRKEILYRLLTAQDGAILYRTLLSHHQQKGVNEAIQWIKENYARPMAIDRLARRVHMSVSSLHHRFKAVTTMSPLQYQKQMRLLEARKILLAGDVEAATAAYRVGYESPSQFSREYRRLFGASPLQDMEYLKHHVVE